MTALQWITTEAKKLKKKFPKKEWKDLVKQASAIYSKKHKGKSPVGKKKSKVGAVKKVAKKNTATKKKSTAKSYHKDTKSHNVKINVTSGIPKTKKYNLFSYIQKMSGHTERIHFFYFSKLEDAKKAYNKILPELKEKKEKGVYTVEIINVTNLKPVKQLNWIKL